MGKWEMNPFWTIQSAFFQFNKLFVFNLHLKYTSLKSCEFNQIAIGTKEKFDLFLSLKKIKIASKIELGKKGLNRIFANYLQKLTLNPTSLWNKR